jgi:hypothetical protein
LLPPEQLLKVAFPGDTVTERIVGTVFREMVILEPLLAAGAGRLVNQRDSRIRPRTTRNTSHPVLRRICITYSSATGFSLVHGGAAARIPLDDDPYTESASAQDHGCRR